MTKVWVMNGEVFNIGNVCLSEMEFLTDRQYEAIKNNERFNELKNRFIIIDDVETHDKFTALKNKIAGIDDILNNYGSSCPSANFDKAEMKKEILELKAESEADMWNNCFVDFKIQTNEILKKFEAKCKTK